MPTIARSTACAIGRYAVISVAATTLLIAPAQGQQARSDSMGIGRMIRDASRALQAGNAVRFLSYFDPLEFGNFANLRSHVMALTAQRQIASSIEITDLEPHEKGYRVRVSWLLQLTYTGDPGPVETRNEAVNCSVEKRSKSWKIVALEPVSFFRP